MIKEKRLLYLMFRHDLKLDQAGFGAVTRTSSSQVSLYSQGDREVPEVALHRAADARQFPRELIPPALRAIRSFRAAANGWSRANRVVTETFFAELLALCGATLEAIVEPTGPTRQPRRVALHPPTERDRASDRWRQLESLSTRQRLAVVEEIEAFQSWALVELVAARSIQAAPNSPAEALDLSELALHIAERCSGGERLRQRSEGYAWFHVANARRATNDLGGSEAALSTAIRLWEAGEAGDPGYFDEAIVRALEAAIRKEQGRLPQALQRIEEALTADKRGLRGKLLLTKAQILGELGRVEASTDTLQEASAHIDQDQEPRLALGVLYEFLLNLCWQGRAIEAAERLRYAESLAERLGQNVDILRVTYLSGVVAAGIGQAEEAEETFEKVRNSFASHEPPLALYCGSVSLELALLLLEQGRTCEVRRLAEEMAWIFCSQGVEREALAALKVFCEAAKRDAATVELARKVIRFLHRAENDPGLKFEGAEEAQTR